ncbi:hypothetical protein [Tenacibaculum halocynthiae]|uniref:hypothetical protein n=1 Tax=Tenacibaculum halocynthiae TaxID=1254437 RepID=UPI003D65A7F5
MAKHRFKIDELAEVLFKKLDNMEQLNKKLDNTAEKVINNINGIEKKKVQIDTNELKMLNSNIIEVNENTLRTANHILNEMEVLKSKEQVIPKFYFIFFVICLFVFIGIGVMGTSIYYKDDFKKHQQTEKRMLYYESCLKNIPKKTLERYKPNK